MNCSETEFQRQSIQTADKVKPIMVLCGGLLHTTCLHNWSQFWDWIRTTGFERDFSFFFFLCFSEQPGVLSQLHNFRGVSAVRKPTKTHTHTSR